MLGQQADVLFAFTQGRQLEWKNRQAIVEVLAKLLGLHQVKQANVGCTHYADIHPVDVRTAQPLHFPVLQEAQQLRLHAQGKLADFVEKQRAPLSYMNSPQARLKCSCKRSSRMTEQFRFQQRFRNGCAVHHHERMAYPGAELMQGLGTPSV